MSATADAVPDEAQLLARAVRALTPVLPLLQDLGARFAEAGHELALVGGPVRDAFLDRPLTDLDLTTSASPDETEAVLRAWAGTTWDMGRAFGTIGCHKGGFDVEVTTYRADAYEPGSRKPVVAFGDSLEEDLVRRDFAVNAMALRLPDAVFVEDPVLVYGRTAVIARSGAPERRGETVAVEETLRGLGYTIRRIESPGTLDGGDVLKYGGTVWVGQGGRSNAEGLAQLAHHLEPEGARVVGVPVSKVLHLKSAVTALPDGTVVGYEPLVDDPTVWEKFLPVPEEPGSHVVLLDGDAVLMAASAPRTAKLFRERGLDVVTVDISEFEKLEGCVTCLSVRLRG